MGVNGQFVADASRHSCLRESERQFVFCWLKLARSVDINTAVAILLIIYSDIVAAVLLTVVVVVLAAVIVAMMAKPK